MPRTTIDLDDAVLHELKQRREREGKPLGVIASQLLARALREDVEPPTDFEWVAGSMGAMVDLDDKDAVWAALDGR